MQLNTQYVLRLEHPVSGLGPFFHNPAPFIGDVYELEYLPGCGPCKIPSIIDDVIEFEEMGLSTHVCGVEYMSHLYEWFGKTLQPLVDAGFKLYMYLIPVSKVLRCESGLQVAFNKADALEVTEIA